MRRGTVIFIVINLIIVGALLNQCSTLISLLFENAERFAIPGAEIPAPDAKLNSNLTQLIPKILHQTYINESIPAKWQQGQQACVKLHDDYKYMLWTDKSVRAFIAKEYEWFLETFDSYPFPIERADAIRYFILYHYGGIYIDLDVGCSRRLDPLLNYSAWLRRTVPTGISNDAIGAVPHHPFFKFVIEKLADYNRNWVLPYISVMGSTGPLFLSVMWKQYMREYTQPDEVVRVLMLAEYKGNPWSFFNISKGSSWHGKDAQTIFWMGKHWFLLTVSGFLVAGVVGSALWWLWSRWLLEPGKTPYGKSKRGGFWSRLSSRGSWKDRYELINRMA